MGSLVDDLSGRSERGGFYSEDGSINLFLMTESYNKCALWDYGNP